MSWCTAKPGYPFTDSALPAATSTSSGKAGRTKKSRSAPLEKRTVNFKVFGHIPSVPVGTKWASRAECHVSGVHGGGLMKGISGCQDRGAYSIVLSGGYEDDIDLGDTFTYTGSGGRDKSFRTGPQTCDQSFENPPNKALKISAATGRPVRVVRGYKLESPYAPPEGYRYDGIYQVMSATLGKGKSGFAVCKFEFRRLPSQPPLPLFGIAPVVKSKHQEASRPVVKPKPVENLNRPSTSNAKLE